MARSTRREGFTLIELVIVIAIIGLLASMALPNFWGMGTKVRVKEAVLHIDAFQTELESFEAEFGGYPPTLAGIGADGVIDPWGRPYRYYNIVTNGLGGARRDKSLVPLNSSYDLYSMGEDGQTRPSLGERVSFDDVVRALDGAFVGKAMYYN